MPRYTRMNLLPRERVVKPPDSSEPEKRSPVDRKDTQMEKSFSSVSSPCHDYLPLSLRLSDFVSSPARASIACRIECFRQDTTKPIYNFIPHSIPLK